MVSSCLVFERRWRSHQEHPSSYYANPRLRIAKQFLIFPTFPLVLSFASLIYRTRDGSFAIDVMSGSVAYLVCSRRQLLISSVVNFFSSGWRKRSGEAGQLSGCQSLTNPSHNSTAVLVGKGETAATQFFPVDGQITPTFLNPGQSTVLSERKRVSILFMENRCITKVFASPNIYIFRSCPTVKHHRLEKK